MKRVQTTLATIAWAALAAAPSARAAPPDVDQAMTFIRGACSLQGASLELKTTPEGRLEVRITLGNGQRRTATLTHRDVDRFSEVATNVMATTTSLAITSCMDPYVSDVVGTLSQLPDRPAAPPPAPFTPPTLPSPQVMPSPPPPAVQGVVRQAQPAGDMPVAVVNGTVATTAAVPAVAAAAGNRLALTVERCKGVDGGHVQCDVKVANRTAQDLKVTVQANDTRLLGEDSSQSKLYNMRLGENNLYPGGNEREIRMDLLADAAPTIQLHFYSVPVALLAVKRLEVSIGARIGADTVVQSFTFANIPIQGR